MSEHIILPNISPKAWEHPADRAALQALRLVPGLKELLATLFGKIDDTSLRLFATGNALKAGPRQAARVYTIVQECARVLDTACPMVFIGNNPGFNASAIGLKTPFLLFNSGLIESLNDEELAFVAGHELGHIASGHAVYRTLLWLIQNVGSMLFPQGLGPLVSFGLYAALMEWYRKAELSCDRAGALSVQNPQACYTGFMKMAGGRGEGTLNLEEFMLQAAEYQKNETALEEILKVFITLEQSHPFPVARFGELKTWIDGGAYKQILEGNYARRDEESSKNGFEEFQENVKNAGEAYQREWDQSKGPLGNTAQQFGDQIKDGLSQLDQNLRKLFGSR